MNTYPENDYRNYLMHWGKGKESKNHKYTSRKMGKNGKWVYTYITNTPGLGTKKNDSKEQEDTSSSDWNHAYYFKDGKYIDIKKQTSDQKPKKDKESKIKDILMKPLNAVSKSLKLKKAKKARKGIPKSARPSATTQSIQHRVNKLKSDASKNAKRNAQNITDKRVNKNKASIKKRQETIQRRNRAYAIEHTQ